MEYFYSHSDNPQQFLQKTFQEGKNRRISFTKICVSILHTISNCGYSTDIKTFELLQKRLSPSQMSMIIDQPTGSKKYTALQRAAYKGNSNMVMLLLLAGANPNYVNSHGENLKKVINGIYAGRNSLEQRIEKLRDHGIRSKTPIKKTTPLQDKLMEFEEVKNKIEDENKDQLN